MKGYLAETWVLFALTILLLSACLYRADAATDEERARLEAKVEQLEQRLQAMDDKYHARTMELQQAAPKHPSNN